MCTVCVYSERLRSEKGQIRCKLSVEHVCTSTKNVCVQYFYLRSWFDSHSFGLTNGAVMTIFFQISQGFQGCVLDFVDWFGEPTGKWSKDRILTDGSGFNTEVVAQHVGWMMFIIYRDSYGTFLSHPEEREVSYSCSNIVWGILNLGEPKYRK